jgi:hypothetical protein
LVSGTENLEESGEAWDEKKALAFFVLFTALLERRVTPREAVSMEVLAAKKYFAVGE